MQLTPPIFTSQRFQEIRVPLALRADVREQIFYGYPVFREGKFTEFPSEVSRLGRTES